MPFNGINIDNALSKLTLDSTITPIKIFYTSSPFVNAKTTNKKKRKNFSPLILFL